MDDNIRRASIIIALEELRSSLQPREQLELPSIRQARREMSETGAEYIYRLLNENPKSCKEQLRLDREMYASLVNLMTARELLKDGKYVKVDEQIGMCLYILAKGASYRDVADRFKHSISTVCKYFRKVLRALVILSRDIIRPHHDLQEVSSEVENHSLYWPYFKDAIGAIDGTLIQAVISDKEGVPFRSRKGGKSWNVLACCSFDQIFTFINVGWEGSAHDLTVWRDSITNSKFGFPHPPESKYYLVDSGYLNTVGYLSPISDKAYSYRYHLPEFQHAPPEGSVEHFNYRHSSLRMWVEQAFGQLKKRWKVLYVMPQMVKNGQMSIIVSVFTLHNFILLHQLGIPIIQHEVIEGTADTNMSEPTRVKKMNELRDKIVREIWSDIGPIVDHEDEAQEDVEM